MEFENYEIHFILKMIYEEYGVVIKDVDFFKKIQKRIKDSNIKTEKDISWYISKNPKIFGYKYKIKEYIKNKIYKFLIKLSKRFFLI